MKWNDLAQNILTAARANIDIDRAFVAPGPSFARDCRLLAVYLQRPTMVPLQRENAGGTGGVMIPQLAFMVVFVNDCVPAQVDEEPPSAADISTWSLAYLDECQRVMDGLLDGDPFGGVEDSVSIGQAEMRGPLGLTASMLVPVTIANIV